MDNFISYQKPRRDYPAIWYYLKPLANKKARFLKEVNSWSARVTRRCQRASLKNSKRFMSRKSDFSVQNSVVSVCCLYLSMVFLCIYCKYQVSTLENRSTTTSINLKRQRLRYISQNDRSPLLSLFAFAGSYVWFLISASIKVRTRTE